MVELTRFVTGGSLAKCVGEWQLGKVRLQVWEGDLWEIDADAVVNSEETDFVLSSNKNTVSGQCRHRYGDTIQAELDAETMGETLAPGTVLETSGGGDYERIFHAGFHLPGKWLQEGDEAVHLEVIRGCTWEILTRASRQGLGTVAFPLIGTGVFDLDPQLLAFQFFSTVGCFAREQSPEQPLSISLVVWPKFDAVSKVIVPGTQAWAPHGRAICPW